MVHKSSALAASSGGGGGGGSGLTLTNTITQTANGFSVGQIVMYNGTSYVLAKADSASDAEVVGIVSAVSGANIFTITMAGYVTGLSGLTAGDVYFLSATVAGALSTTNPSTIGQVSKPLLIAVSSTSGYFFNWRGEVISSTNTNGTFTPITNANSPYSLLPTDTFILANASGGPITITTLNAASYNGQEWRVKKIDSSSNSVTIDFYGTETGDNSLTQIIQYQYTEIGIKSDGSNYWLF